jgi:uncharacterized protein YodC (DUF2158 family)
MFNVGDVVRLKSGGPIMTIGEINDDTAHCTWFVKEGTPIDGEFKIAILEKPSPGTL